MQSFLVRTTKTLIRLRGCAADLNLRWAHMSDGTFSPLPAHFLWTFATLWANSADDKLAILFYFFPEDRIRHFIEIRFDNPCNLSP